MGKFLFLPRGVCPPRPKRKARNVSGKGKYVLLGRYKNSVEGPGSGAKKRQSVFYS